MITDVNVDWWEGYGNWPELHVWVDYCIADRAAEMRDAAWLSVPVFRVSVEIGRLYYRSHGDGRFEYLYHNPAAENGFGGRTFRLVMPDGSERLIRGPWTSNAGVVREIVGLEIMDVVLHGSCGGMGPAAFDVETIREAIEKYRVGVTLGLRGYDRLRWSIIDEKPTDGAGVMASGSRPTISAVPAGLSPEPEQEIDLRALLGEE